MSQSAYGQAETTGSGSSFTSQLADACGVRAQWLATGDGPMLPDGTEDTQSASERLYGALDVLSKELLDADEDTRIAVGELLAAMATHPYTAKNKSRLILRLLVTERDNSPSSPHDGMRRSHIFGELGVLDLGEKNGRRDPDAAAGGEKK
jgi:hypothetical protein